VSGAAATVYRFEMAVTQEEFVRSLPHAVGSFEQRYDRSFEGCTDQVRWSVRCVEMPQRRIGSLALPVLDVTVTIEAADTEAGKAFVGRFLRAYQRAGG
jgi:hypothetical protein